MMTYEANDFRPGDRVQLHPATDLWMRGARYGTVDRVMRNGRLVVFVDALGRQVKIDPALIGNIL